MLVVARKKVSSQSTAICGRDKADGPIPGPQSHPGVKVSHTRSKSAPSSYPKGNDSDTDTASEINGQKWKWSGSIRRWNWWYQWLWKSRDHTEWK